MSSFRDLVKKVNAEKNAGTSASKSSSFRDLVTKVNNGTIKVPSRLNSSQVNDWYKGVKTFSDMGYKYLTKEGYKTPNTNILTSLDSYLSQADEVGHYIRSNRDAFDDYEKAIQDHYDTVSYLRSLKTGIESSNKFYSDFKDEADYNFWDEHSTVENRQEWYQGQQDKIDELGEVYDNYHTIDLWYQDYQERPWAYTEEEAAEKLAIYEKHKSYKQQYGSDKDILNAIDVAKSEMENYKRGNYNENGRFYGSKVVDDNYAVTQREDFGITSANRDYTNASHEELWNYDMSVSEGSEALNNGGYFDDEGNIRDSEGNIVQKASAPAIQDKLGMFLQASEEEKTEAYNMLSSSNGNYNYTWGDIVQEGDQGSWKYLSDTELGIYYTYLGESQEKAYQFLSDMKTELNRRQTLDEIGQWHEGYEDATFLEKIALNAATVPAKLVSNVAGFVEDAANTVMGNEINPYSAAHSGMHYSQTVRGDTAEELNKSKFKIPLIDFTLGDIYQTGMSRLDSALATAVFGGGGTAFLGMGAAEEEAYRLYQQGASAEQITLDAFAAGVAETAWEYFSYGKLKELERVKNPGDWVKNVLIQGWNEAIEEAGTEVTNILTNAIIMASQSDLADMYKENEERAFRTFLDIFQQTMHSAFGGFIGGAMAGGVQGGQSYIDSQKQYAAAGEKINDSVGGVDALMKLANEVAGVSDAKMQKSLNKQVASVEKKASNRKVGKLYESLGDAYNAQNKADVATILEMNKFSSEQAKVIADAVVGLASGNLTEQQAKVLEMYKDNEDVKGVIAGYDLDERSTIGKRNLAMANFEYGVAFSEAAKKHADKAFTPEGKFAVSSDGEAKALVTENVDGKTITKDTGEVIDIKGVKEIRKTEVNGKKKIELVLDIGDGKEINAKNVAYATKKDALIYEAIANLGDNIDKDTANRLIAKYDGSDAMVFARGIAQAYTYGFYGLDRSEMKGKNTLASELTEEQRNFAYGLGEKYRPVKDAKDKAEAKVTRTPGEKGVYYRDKNGNATDIRTYLNEVGVVKDVQQTAIEVMEKMSEMLGVRFNVYESWVENGTRYYLDQYGDVVEGNPNGFYDTTTGEIYIDLNAGQDYQGTMLFTVAHELTHFMRQWSPEQFTKISNIVFKHGKMKGSVAKMAAVKQAKAKAKGKPISYDTAIEEVVADGMETILKDGKVLEFMEDVKKTDHEAWAKLKEWFQKLGEFLKKLVDAYGGRTAHTVEGRKVAEFAEDLLTQIKQLYAEGAVTAGERYQMAIGNVKVSNQITMKEDVIDSSNTGISKEAKTGVKMQERTEFEAMPKQVFRVSTTNGEAESKMLGTNKSVKELRDANFRENGFTKEEIDKMNGFIKEMADNMAKYRLKYKFVGLQNIHDAKIILDPMSGKIVLSAMVNNSDYSVNFDFTKICKKRVALQEVLEALAREKGKVTDGKVTEVNLSPANIKHINDILASYGVETACLCCFVESKRYNIQNYYQEKVVDVWNALVDEVVPNAGYFNFADSDVDTSKIPDSEFAELEMQMKEWAGKTGKAKDVEQKMREFLADAPAARKKLRFSDLVTANGRTNLHKLYPEIESLILSKLGQSAPKSVEAFTPYNGEIDLLEAKSDGDIVKYLYSIAGVRSQSFSDFMIAHVFDVLQKTASMSARKMPAHVYTKEIARAMLFGMTGEKHNMSVLHNVDPNVDSWSAGLSKNGEYNFSDYEAYKKGYSEFVQSIGWKDAVTLQNTEGYSKDCGIIGVGFSYNHMMKLHNDPEVRQVIGYHTSQMPVEVKPLTHLDKAADYTKVQNTMKFVGFAKPNYAIPEGVPSYATPPQDVTYKGNKTNKVSDTFDLVGTFNKLSKGKTGDARTAAAKETLRQLLEYANDHGYVITTASGEKGKGEFGLYEDVQKTENPYLTTDHYIEYCIERGFLPMFYEFSMNPNYYKDIFDFNVFDRKSYNPETGLHEDSNGRKAYAPQTAVHMLNEDGSLAFPENFFDIVDKQMSSYNSYMQDVDSKMPSIMDEVRAVTNSTTLMSDRDSQKVLYQDRINELTEEEVYTLIENSNHGEYALDTFIPVRRDTPPLLVELSKKDGLPPVKNLPIIMNVEHIQQCMDEEVAATDGKRGHALTTDNIIDIIKGLDDPRYVFFQKDNKRYCEVVEYAVGNKGKKAMAIVTYTGNKNQDLMNGFPGREYNILVTAYPPDAKYWKDYQKSSNNVIIYDKTKDAPQGSYGSHVPSLLSGSPFATKVTQPGTEVKRELDRDSLTPEQQKHFDYNQKQKTVGSALKTLKGSAIKRSTKFGVGKEIGGEIYFHKDYAEDILPDEVLSQALQLLEEEQPGFEYNCLKYNPKTGVVAFQESPDFDSAREPVVGDYVSVNTNTGVVKTGHSNYIWHHKWNWVKNDYSGFDVAKSWNWSKQWLSTLTEVSDGNGIDRWNAQLDKFGLPHDGALLSDREQEYDSKDTSVKILPATFTKFGLKATDRVLDWGGGQYDIAKKAVELGYPGIKFEVVDAFNRTKSHNDRILEEYAENPATVLTINNVLNVIKETDIIEDVIRESKEYLAADGVCYIKIYEGNDVDGKTGVGKVTSSGWQNNQPAEWYRQFAEKYYQYVERSGDILIASDKPIDRKSLPKASKEATEAMRGKVKEIAKSEPSMRASLYSDRDDAPIFYSQMAKIVDGMKQEKLGAASIVSMLRGKGVKAEEIKWSGIETFLDGKKSVTKAELQEFIAGSMLQIEEEVLTNEERPYSEEHQKLLDEYTTERDKIGETLAAEWKRITGDDFPIRNLGAGVSGDVESKIRDINLEYKKSTFEGRLLDKLRKDLKEVIANNDDFGFDSWKEALISIHRNRKNFVTHYEMSTNDKAVIVKYCNALSAYNEMPNKISDADTDTLRDIAENIEKYNRKIIQVRSNHNSDNAKYMAKWGQYKLKGGENYREMLFKIPGSSYSNTAMDVHWGEREGVLAHARIQDLNTFLGKMLFVEEIQSDWHNEGHKSGYESDAAAILEKIKDLKQQWHSLYNEMLEARGEEARAISEKMDAIDTERARLAKKVRFGDSVPDAPFKDTYHEYVMKRLLRVAAEEGYDSIGWTTKEVQMQRWNPDRKTNEQMGIEAKNPNAVAFEDGYRIEYDQDIPKFLNKYGKKWGTQVGKTVLDNGTEVWSMAITDSMKESVMTEGQALYSDRDNVGYHAGDLGKSEDFFDMTGTGRATGHFGTGTYFVGDEAQISDRFYGNRPHEKVDFGKYNLFKVRNYEEGSALHSFLMSINNNILHLAEARKTFEEYYDSNKNVMDAAEDTQFGEWSEDEDVKNNRKVIDEYIESNFTEGEKQRLSEAAEKDYDRAQNATVSEYWKQGLEADYNRSVKYFGKVETLEEYVARRVKSMEESIAGNKTLSVEDWYYANAPTFLKEHIEASENYRAWYRGLTLRAMQSGIWVGEVKLRSILDSIYDTAKGYGSDGGKHMDSPSTMFMKALGYEGIDVRGVNGLDNSTYGSVIYDLKGEDLARKQEIGTARFQDRDDDSVSNRSLLANAFEGLAKDDTERNKIREYKEHIALINDEEKKLRELNEQIKELSFSKGPRDTKKIKALRFDAVQAANRINTYDKQLLRLEASKPLQNVLNREKRLAYKKAEERGKEALAAYKSRVEAKQKETTEKWRKSRKDAVAKARETGEKRTAREKLQKLVLDTVKWITYPTKTDVKCPDILKKPYADFLNGIDLSSKRLENGGDPTKNDLRLANAMDSLATALDKIMTAQDPTQETEKVLDTGYLDLPVNFVKQLRDMTENIKAMMVEGDYVVNSMTAAEVRQLSQMIRTLNHAIKTMSNLYANLRFANVEALGVDTMDFMDALGEIEKTGGVKDFVEWDNALPYYAFKRFGKGGESVFEGLMDAQDKLAFLAQAIFDFQEKTWTGEEAKAWSEDTHTITLPNGNELTLTTADAMSIYCLSRREQGLKHLLGGGTRVMGIQKGSKKAKDSRSVLTIEDISAINSSLTDRQKQVADGIQQFMSTVCSEWGNEISMKRFLTKEFTEKFYFPIESNDENLATKDPAAQQSDLFRLLNISATKPLTPGANNEVIIRNIFDVFTGHASDMARLNAYGMALLDYMKWLNYREKTANEQGQINVRGVRKSMELAYGNAAKSYVLNLVKDVNGRPSDGGDPNILMKWMRAAKTASVGSSLRVATLQITSYPRAALVLSPKSLTLGLSKLPQIEKAKKYCGIALWKSFGFYDTNISRSIEDQMKGVTDVKQKLIELSLKGAEWGDAITWGALWNACEYEVAQTTKNKVGSEEFYQEVGKKLREVVYRTQVVDSMLTRSQIMRSKRGMAQESAAFMSEPTLSANILMDAGFEFNAEKRRTGSAKAAWNKTGKYIGRAVAVYAIGQLTAALLEGLWDAWRDEDDEEFGEKYLDAFIENLVLDLAPFNKLPIVSDVFEAALAMFDVGFYSSDKMSTTWLTQAVSAVDTWKDALSGNSSVTVYNALYKSVRAISSFFGVSASGVMREAVALWNNTAGAYDATLKIRTYDSSQEELGEMLLDAFVKGNDRRANSLKAEFKDEEDSKKAIRTAVKKRYEAGDIDADTAEQYLVKFGGVEKDKAYWTVEGWEYKTETGEDFQKYNNFYEAVKTGKNLKAVIKEYTDNGVESKTLASQITDHFKPLYKAMSKSERASIKGYLLNAYELLGYDRSKKSKDIDKWVED